MSNRYLTNTVFVDNVNNYWFECLFRQKSEVWVVKSKMRRGLDLAMEKNSQRGIGLIFTSGMDKLVFENFVEILSKNVFVKKCANINPGSRRPAKHRKEDHFLGKMYSSGLEAFAMLWRGFLKGSVLRVTPIPAFPIFKTKLGEGERKFLKLRESYSQM